MPPRTNRYGFERVAGSPELEALQDRLGPLLEQLSTDRGDVENAATAGGTTYEAADDAAWSGDPPTTIQDALDRIAAAIGPVP